MSRYRAGVGVAVVALIAVLATVPLASAAPAQAPITDQVIASVTGTAADGSTFAGSLHQGHLVRSHGRIVAVTGTVTGTVTDAAGNVVGTVTQAVNVPVTAGTAGTRTLAAAAATCPILNLTLGPLDLNLLGLTVTSTRSIS